MKTIKAKNGKSYTKKQICEAIEYWKKQLMESIENPQDIIHKLEELNNHLELCGFPYQPWFYWNHRLQKIVQNLASSQNVKAEYMSFAKCGLTQPVYAAPHFNTSGDYEEEKKYFLHTFGIMLLHIPGENSKLPEGLLLNIKTNAERYSGQDAKHLVDRIAAVKCYPMVKNHTTFMLIPQHITVSKELKIFMKNLLVYDNVVFEVITKQIWWNYESTGIRTVNTNFD